MTKKSNVFIIFLYSFSIFIVSSFILAFTTQLFKNEVLGYTTGYIICIAILYAIYRKKIKEDIKNFKTDFKKIFPKVFIVSAILLIVETILANIFQHMGITSPNQSYAINLINTNIPVMMFYCVVLAPVFEELCFRLPYHYSKSNKVLTFVIYTVIFTFTHILGISNLITLLYFIPYLLLATAIGYPFYKSDNILMSTMVHILNNFIAVMLILI